jgi:hypothetical protein
MIVYNTLEAIRLRPRFKYVVHNSADESLKMLRKHFDESEYKFKGQFVDEYISIFVNPADDHFWSPTVSLTILQHIKGSVIKGMFGPKPNVWTLFALLRLTMLSGSFFLTIIGLAQLFLEKEPLALYGLIPVLLLAIVVWIAGRIGRERGKEQMALLKNYVFNALKELDENVEETSRKQ